MGLVLLHQNLVYISTYPSCYQPCHWCVKWIVPPWWVTSLLNMTPSRTRDSMYSFVLAVEDAQLHALFVLLSGVVLSRPYLSKSASSLLASLSRTSTWLLATPRCISTNVHITYHFPTLNGANGGDLIPTYTRFWCNSTRPIYTSTDISDVATSCFPCCSYFLFELMYIHPVWSVSALSCLRQCSIVLFLSVVATSCTSSWAVFWNYQIFVVGKSCLPWCSYFLFDQLYLLPISYVVGSSRIGDVHNSCFAWCSYFLFETLYIHLL